MKSANATSGGLESSHRVFYYGFIGILVVCMSPAKLLCYAAPFGFLIWILSKAPSLLPRNRLVGVIGAIGAIGVFYVLIAPEFLISNYLLAIVTFSSFLPLALLDSRRLASPELLHRMLLFCSAVVLFEGILGIVQALYGVTQTGGFGGANGDHVEGTIHPQLAPDGSFSNPMFAINLVAMMLAGLCAPDAFARWKRPRLLVGVVALVLASVIHVLMFLLAALVGALFVARAKRGLTQVDRVARRNIAMTFVIVCVLGWVAMGPEALVNIEQYADKIVDTETLDIPRAIMLYRVFTELPDDAPLQPYLGLGPGQFSSRAAMLAAGVELMRDAELRTPPLMSPQSTRLASDYGVQLSISVAELDENIPTFGSSQQPFSSYLTLYTETGAFGVLVAGILLVRLLRRCRRRMLDEPCMRPHVLAFSALTLFFVLLGWQQNYWEVPQLLLVGFLLMKVIYANIMFSTTDVKS